MSEQIKARFVVETEVIDVFVKDHNWFVHFDGSKEAIGLGHKSEPQPFTITDRVRITFEKV